MNFIMDARTGLGRFREFTISNYQLMMELIEKCVQMSVEDILMLPDVVERVDLYVEHEAKAKEQIKGCSTVHKNLVILDLRPHDETWVRERFGDQWLGFEPASLEKWLQEAGLDHVRVTTGARLVGDPFTVMVASGVKR